MMDAQQIRYLQAHRLAEIEPIIQRLRFWSSSSEHTDPDLERLAEILSEWFKDDNECFWTEAFIEGCRRPPMDERLAVIRKVVTSG